MDEIMLLIENYVQAVVRCHEANRHTFATADQIRNNCKEELKKALENK